MKLTHSSMNSCQVERNCAIRFRPCCRASRGRRNQLASATGSPRKHSKPPVVHPVHVEPCGSLPPTSCFSTTKALLCMKTNASERMREGARPAARQRILRTDWIAGEERSRTMFTFLVLCPPQQFELTSVAPKTSSVIRPAWDIDRATGR